MKTILLPGMGANSKMYPVEKYSILQDVVFADWPKYNGEETLEAMAQSIIHHYDISSEMAVGGSSLGGMVAIEIAKLTDIKHVILIGSARNPENINPLRENSHTL